MQAVGFGAVAALAAGLKAGEVLLGIDSGKRRWGVAISDDALRVALPLAQYVRTKYVDDLAFLAGVIAERRVGGGIIGWPLHMNAERGAGTQAAQQLGRDLERETGLRVAYWDERMSSQAVERSMIEGGDLSRRKRDHRRDKLAATFMLQGALDALRLGGIASRGGSD